VYHFDSDGNEIWSYDYNDSYQDVEGTIILQDDNSILFTTYLGYLVKAGPLGNQWWAVPGGFLVWDGPSLGDDGTVYYAGHSMITPNPGLVSAMTQGGNEVWTVSPPGSGSIASAVTLGENGIYVGDDYGILYCLDYSDGSVIWSKQLGPYGNAIQNIPAEDFDGKIYVGAQNGYLYCLDPTDGGILWSYQTSGPIFVSAPVVDGANHVYVGNYSGRVYCLDTTDGSEVWSYHLGAPIYCKSPAIGDDGTLFIANNSGRLFAFKDL
jgi:outer membrane protein assembly factor BamB